MRLSEYLYVYKKQKDTFEVKPYPLPESHYKIDESRSSSYLLCTLTTKQALLQTLASPLKERHSPGFMEHKTQNQTTTFFPRVKSFRLVTCFINIERTGRPYLMYNRHYKLPFKHRISSNPGRPAG